MTGWSQSPRWLHFLVCVLGFAGSIGWIAIDAPELWALERTGLRSEGILVRYDRTGGRNSRYIPVVAVENGGMTREVRGRDGWSWRWHDVGDHLTVLELPRIAPAVGGLGRRWSPMILAVAIGVVTGWTVLAGVGRFLRSLFSIRV